MVGAFSQCSTYEISGKNQLDNFLTVVDIQLDDDEDYYKKSDCDAYQEQLLLPGEGSCIRKWY